MPPPQPAALAPQRGQASNALRQQMREALQSGDHAALTRAAMALARMGGGMSDHGFDSFAPQLDPATLAADAPDLPDGNRVERLRSLFHDNGKPDDLAPQQVAEVPAEYRIVEGIAYDRTTDRLFVSTVVDGRLAYLHKGEWHEVPLGLPRGALFGMAADARHRLLWISTASVAESALRDHMLTGLIAVDLDRLSVVDRVAAPPGAGTPGDVAVSRDGTVYVSDSKTGAILRHGADSDGMKYLVPPGRFASPQGMAFSADQRSLYVADYSTGLWIVRLNDGRVKPMAVAMPMMLDGIDGLARVPWENALIAVQNGTSPRRVVKLYLSRRGDRVVSLDVSHIVAPGAGDPGLVTIHGSQFWVVGDGQWERYGPGGVLKDGEPPRPTPIIEAPDTEIVVT